MQRNPPLFIIARLEIVSRYEHGGRSGCETADIDQEWSIVAV